MGIVHKATFKIAEKIAPHLTDAQWRMIEDYNSYLDQKSVEGYYKKVMKWEKCTYEEAIEKCKTEVNYRVGYKMCSPAVLEMMKIEDCSGIQRFMQWLDEEELQVFLSDECPHTPEDVAKAYRKIYKKEKTKQAIMGKRYKGPNS